MNQMGESTFNCCVWKIRAAIPCSVSVGEGLLERFRRGVVAIGGQRKEIGCGDGGNCRT